MNLSELGIRAKQASVLLAKMNVETKNRALIACADALINERKSILEANAKDVLAGREKGMNEGLIDRLMLTEVRLPSHSDRKADGRRVFVNQIIY